MQTFDPHQYGRTLAPLLATNRCRTLGCGEPADTMLGPLRALSVDAVFDTGALADREMASCCIAAVWLLYDLLDESHTISQAIETPTGSFWHAIMHRREGDFSNSKYWFGRVGQHPIFPDLAAQAAEIAAADPQDDAIDQFATGADWNPDAFVDLCQQVQDGIPDIRQECELIQQAEWELLFDFCYRQATQP